MRILFDTREEKEDYIVENAMLDDEYEEIYVCPSCGTKYEDIDEACDCCPCSREEAYGGDYSTLYDDEE